ncbi:hypothetical protein [Bacillus toyonensis]|uniref:hypothetical protein n=1 Tax=Bacillus toyonensis TaxID=155322 RepID=UPI000BF26F09|nr:hypothetical protein [Bacillus toyonensis]PGF05252.1 hypothetical protein COM61_02230 [Bacillus toyonensis]
MYYGYKCETGCGHITLTDKYYKTKLTHCAVCGEKKTLVYIGEFEAKAVTSNSLVSRNRSRK